MTERKVDMENMLGFDAHSVASVAALPDKEQMAIAFAPMGNEKGIVVLLPAGAVGHMVAQIKSAHAKLALTSSSTGAVLLPIALTGARPYQAPDGGPLLLLQFDSVFELAVELSTANARQLVDVIERTLAPSRSGPPKPH